MVQAYSLKKKLIVIAGPTAIGKSELAVELCMRLNGEVVSADSAQIYRGLNIGTGKVTTDEAQGVLHHLIDIINPDENFTVDDYVRLADSVIEQIDKREKVAVVAGGTGFYIRGLLYSHEFGNAPPNIELREKYRKLLEQNGCEYLHAMLYELDPLSAKKLHYNDIKRVMRALEIFESTGKPKSDMEGTSVARYNDFALIGLEIDRKELYERIGRRVDKMVNNGLIDEVKSLLEFRTYNSMQAIGYKEIVAYLDGIMSKSDAIELIKKNSRNYAKRQLTYLRSMPDIIWLDASNHNILRTMSDIVTNSRIATKKEIDK